MICHRTTPRAIESEQAREVRQVWPPVVSVTALWLDESEDWVAQVVQQLRPECLQFHGNESPEFCERWQTPYIKAIPMGSIDDPDAYAQTYNLAQGFLLDSNVAGRLGGSGDTFDWSKIPSSFDYPLVLAGGINSSNVAAAIKRVKPWGVDVSTGVEVSRGVKSTALIDQFFDEVERGDKCKMRNNPAD